MKQPWACNGYKLFEIDERVGWSTIVLSIWTFYPHLRYAPYKHLSYWCSIQAQALSSLVWCDTRLVRVRGLTECILLRVSSPVWIALGPHPVEDATVPSEHFKRSASIIIKCQTALQSARARCIPSQMIEKERLLLTRKSRYHWAISTYHVAIITIFARALLRSLRLWPI